MSGWRAGALEKEAAEESHRRQHVGLVDTRDLRYPSRTPPAPGERKRRLEQPLGTVARDPHRVEHRLLPFATALGARREQPFGRLADDHEVDRVRPWIREWDAHAGQHADRPDAGVELEAIAKIDLRHDLGAVGIANVGVSHGAEEDGVRGRRRAERVLGQGDPGPLVKLGPALRADSNRRRSLARVRRHRIEQRQARRHDLAADAIAGKHCNLKVSA